MIDLSSAEARTAAAGEHVLGTLDDADQAEFSAALARDPSLQAEVYAWQDHLLALSLHAPAVPPRPQLWRRIAFSLDAMVGGPAAHRNPDPSSMRHAQRPRWWQRVGLWQGLGGAALAAAMLMAVLLVQRSAEAPATRYLAVLQSPEDRSTGWLVEIEARRQLRLVPVGTPTAAPAGKALQFWTKPQGAAGPTSLGLVQAGQTVQLPVSRLPGVGEQVLFEITLEPANGSPIGRPTGPILYVGRTVRL